jgi:hypothetical protein
VKVYSCVSVLVGERISMLVVGGKCLSLLVIIGYIVVSVVVIKGALFKFGRVLVSKSSGLMMCL